MKSEGLLAKHIQKSCLTGVLGVPHKNIHKTEICTPATTNTTKKTPKDLIFIANHKCEDMAALEF